MPEESPRQRATVWLLTLVAFGLRVWGVRYGFPLGWARPDEERWVRISQGLLENPNPYWFEWPTLHGYLLAGLYWLWGLFRVARGDFASFHAYTNEDQAIYPADLVLLGRISSAVIGALAVPLTYRLGERLGSRGGGLVAALCMAACFGPIRDSHWALIEATLLVGILSTLLLVLRALEQPTLARFALAGLVAGLTTSAKYSGASLAVPIAVAGLLARRREGRSLVGTLWDPRLLLAAAVMVAGFFAGTPYVFAAWEQFKVAMWMREWSYRDASFGTDVGFVHHLLFSMRYSHGVLQEVAGILGLLALGWRDPGRMTVLAYGVFTYAALGNARIVPMRYASSLAPAVVLGAAWLLVALVTREGRPRRALLLLASLLVVAEPAYRALRFDRLLSLPDTRVQAREWLNGRLPAGAAVMARDSKALRWGRPALEDRYTVVGYPEGSPAGRVARVARREGAVCAVLAESPTGYIPWAPEIHQVLRGLGAVEAVFDPYGPGAHPVYDPHDAFFVPVAGFEQVRQPGPRVTIYRLRTTP